MLELILDLIGNTQVHHDRLLRLIDEVPGPIRIISPYVKESDILAQFTDREVCLLTSTDVRDCIAGASSIKALDQLLAIGVSIKSLPRKRYPLLHAKVYIFGDEAALVTSANFTSPGIGGNGATGNIEAGVLLTEKESVSELGIWFDNLCKLAGDFDQSSIDDNVRHEIEVRRNEQEQVERNLNSKPTTGWKIDYPINDNDEQASSRPFQSKLEKRTKRVKIFEYLMEKPRTGREIANLLKSGTIPRELKLEQEETPSGKPPRIVHEVQFGGAYSLTESGRLAFVEGTINSDAPRKSKGPAPWRRNNS